MLAPFEGHKFTNSYRNYAEEWVRETVIVWGRACPGDPGRWPSHSSVGDVKKHNTPQAPAEPTAWKGRGAPGKGMNRVQE